MVSATFTTGDLPENYHSLVNSNTDALVGAWEEIKSISDSTGDILSDMGIGFMKRKAIAAATLKLNITKSSTDAAGNPVFTYVTAFPLGITKQQTFPTDGSCITIPDKDTCDWKAQACCHDGRVIQKREGAKGTWYDCRAVLSKHPQNKSDASELLILKWTFITPKGTSRTTEQWFKRTG